MPLTNNLTTKTEIGEDPSYPTKTIRSKSNARNNYFHKCSISLSINYFMKNIFSILQCFFGCKKQ